MASISRFLRDDNRMLSTVSLILLLSLAVRVVFNWIIYPQLLEHGISADNWPDSYAVFSENLVHGHGFAVYPGVPSLMRGPIYPLFGALIFVLFGIKNLIAVQIIHALLDGLTSVFAFLIGTRVFNRKIGFITALLFIIYPLSIWYSARMSMVSFITLLYVVLTLLIIKGYREMSLKLSLWTGLLLGIVTLTLPVTMLFPPWLFLVWLIAHRNFGQVLKHTLIVSAIAVIIVLPWTVRNYQLSGRVVPVSMGGGYAVLFGDLFVEKFDGFSPYSAEYPSERALQALMNERIEKMLASEGMEPKFTHIDIDPDAASVVNTNGIRSMTRTPLRFVKKIAVQVVTFWYLGNTRSKTLAILLIQLALVIPWLIAGIYYSSSNRVQSAIPLLMMILYLNLIYALTVANARHGMPVMPLALCVAAYGMIEIIRSIRRKFTQSM